MIEFIAKLADKRDLSKDEAREAMNTIMSGKATDAQIGSFLTALSLKGETAEELIKIIENGGLTKEVREFVGL